MATIAEEIAFTRGLIAGRERRRSLASDRKEQVHDSRFCRCEVVIKFEHERAHGVVDGKQVVLGSGCQIIHAHTVEETR